MRIFRQVEFLFENISLMKMLFLIYLPFFFTLCSYYRELLNGPAVNQSTQKEGHIPWECVTVRVRVCVQADCPHHGGGQRAQLPITEAVVGVQGKHI